MNKKQLFHNSLLVLVGIVCAVGLSYVHAATYSDPTSTAPAGNTETPLNTGITDQIKSGGLSVNAFIANANAELDQKAYFGGVLHADPSNTNSTIAFGGTDASSIMRKVALAITGGFSNTGTLASTPLANTTTSAVCADQNGNVILCSVTDMCSNISGTQTTVPAGYVANSDGTCSVAVKRYYSHITSSNKSAQYFTSNVINSHLTYTSATHNGMPYIATLGLDNDTPYGWVVDSIKTINNTSFNPNQGTIMNVTENGSYDLKIASSGTVGIKGKFSADNNFIAADFYMKIHHASDGSDQWVRLANTSNPNNSLTHEPYPVAGKTIPDFFGSNYGSASSTNLFFGITLGGGGQNWMYVPYNFNFDQTFQLSQGDTVDVDAIIYGISTTANDLPGIIAWVPNAFHDSPNNFFYSIESDIGNTTFDFTETPQ